MATLLLEGVSVLRAEGIFVPVASFYDYEYETDYDYDRLSRERRPAAQVDDYLERGNATVTLSPVFDEGIRVAAWANDNDDENYEFGLASAIYFFRIPRDAREIRIRIRYEGSGYLSELGDEIAGRVWIRNVRREESQDPNEPLPGDTFILRKNRRSEVIRIPALGYVNEDGLMELHVVADGSNRLDVEYIEVETYAREPRVRVVRRYVPFYEWRPWRYYTYAVFYGGPFYFPTDYGYYVYWDFPFTDTVFVSIRRRYHTYLYDTWVYRYPTRRVVIRHYSIYEPRGTRYLNRWTSELNTIRDQYERNRTTVVKERRPPDEAIQRAVSTALQNYQQSPVRSSVTTQGYEVQKMRRSASVAPRSFTLQRSDARTPSRTPEAAKTRRESETTPQTQSLLDVIRRSRAQSVVPPPSSSETKTRRGVEPPSSYTERRTVPSSPPASSASESEKSRRGSTVKSAPSASSPSSSASSSSSDDEEKKKRRR